MSSVRNRLIKAAEVPKETLVIETEDGPLSIVAKGLSLTALGLIQNSAVAIDEETGERSTDLAKMGPQLIIAGAFDLDGAPLFTAADIEMVAGLSAGVMEPIMSAIARLSGLGDAALKAALKNSDTITTSVSSSPSPES